MKVRYDDRPEMRRACILAAQPITLTTRDIIGKTDNCSPIACDSDRNAHA